MGLLLGPLPHSLGPRWGVGALECWHPWRSLEIPGEALLEPAAPWGLRPSSPPLFSVPAVELRARTGAALPPRGAQGHVLTLHGGRLSLWLCLRQAHVVALTWLKVVLRALSPTPGVGALGPGFPVLPSPRVQVETDKASLGTDQPWTQSGALLLHGRRS